MDSKSATAARVSPLADRVVVRALEETEQMRGGLFIPDTAKEKPQQGEIVAVGPGGRDEKGQVQPLDVKAGDRFLFCKCSCTEIKLHGEDHMVMKEADLMGIITGAAGAGRKAA